MSRVLLVEDDATCRLLLERELREAGHVVQAARDALEAESLARAFVPQVIVADVRLPCGADGVDLCRRLREELPDAEVILVTAFGSIQTAIDGVRLGAFDFFLKPFDDLDQLRRSVAKAAERVERRRAEIEVARHASTLAERRQALLDELPLAIVLVDESGRVHGHNRAAQPILAAADGLRIADDGRLCCLRHQECEMLVGAMAACCSGSARRVASLRVSRGQGRPDLRVLVLPVAVQTEVGQKPSARMAAVVASVPDARSTLADGALLARLYGLTPAEGAILARLVDGASVREACREMGVSLATGRTHLSRVLSKTGTHRQSELLALVLSGPALLASGVAGTPRPAPARGAVSRCAIEDPRTSSS
jgi:FixJ family two-component response regulator